jgi:adenylate kinase
MSVIFLAGAHSVGKTFLGNPAAEALGLIHCSASQLIREEKGRVTWDAAKRVEEIDDNQKALIRAIERKRNDGHRLLIDGHFVLRNASGSITPIEVDVFDAMKLCGVVLLEEQSDVVVNRLRERDGQDISVTNVVEMANAERDHARRVTAQLGVAFVRIASPTLEILTQNIAAIISASEDRST